MSVPRSLLVALLACFLGASPLIAQIPESIPDAIVDSDLSVRMELDVEFDRDWLSDGSGAWEVSGGKLILGTAGTPGGTIRRPAAIALLRDHSFGDVVIEGEVRSTAQPSVTRADILLVFGYQSPTKFYYVHLSGITDGVHNGIFIVNDSDRRRIDDGTAAPLLADREWHRVRLERDVASGRIAVYMDGAQEPGLVAVDGAFSSGAAGFGSFDDTGEFRSLTFHGKSSSDHPEARPGAGHPELAASGAWCWFGDPRGVRFKGIHDRIYAGWVDSAGSIVVSSLDLQSGERAEHTLHPEFNKDDHANPALMVIPDGTVVVFYTSHGSDVSNAMYYRLSERREDITAWGERLEIGSNTEGPRGYTYPNPVRLSQEEGRVYLFWRGGNFKPSFSYTDDLLTWAPAQTLIQSEVATVVRPYVKIASNSRDAIHFAFTDGHPRNEPQNSIYYLRYRDGNFTRADGSTVGTIQSLPLVHERADLVYNGRLTNVRAWIWDVAEDREGNPVIVYTRLPAEDNHRYHYARWNGAEWVDTELTAAGGWFPHTPEGVDEPEPHYSGGIVLDHEDPSVVYLSRPVDGVFEIERWWTEDEGASWQSRPVTENSTHDNVRPFVVRGHDGSTSGLLWMENRHYRHYLDFDSAIRMESIERQ